MSSGPTSNSAAHSPEFLARWADYPRRKIKDVLNERYLLSRKVEREGFRRVLGAVVVFVGYKFVRHRFFGAGDGSKGGL